MGLDAELLRGTMSNFAALVPPGMNTPLFVLLMSIGIFVLVVGGMVFFRERSYHHESRLPGYYWGFFIFSILIFNWHFGYAMIFLSRLESEAFFWWRFAALGYCLYQPVLLHFFLEITKARDSVLPKKTWLIYIPGIVFYAMALTGNMFVKSFTLTQYGLVEMIDTASPMYWVFLLYIFGYLGSAFYISRRAAAKAQTRRERRQFRMLFIVGVCMLGAGIIMLLLKNVVATDMPLLVNGLSIFLFIGFLVAMRRYRFMDISVATLYRRIIASVRELIIVADAHGSIAYANGAALEMLGYETLSGREAADIIICYTECCEALYAGGDTLYEHGALRLVAESLEELPVFCYSTLIIDRFEDSLGTLFVCTPADAMPAVPGEYDLTERERRIVLLLNQGYTVQQIADQLYIAHGTAKNHIHHIYKKTGAANRVQLLRKMQP